MKSAEYILITLFISILCFVSCSDNGIVYDIPNTDRDIDKITSNRNTLKRRIDLNESRINLHPNFGIDFGKYNYDGYLLSDIVPILKDTINVKIDMINNKTINNGFHLISNIFRVNINPAIRNINIVRKDINYSNMPDNIDDQYFCDTSIRLMKSIGALESEMKKYRIKNLIGAVRPEFDDDNIHDPYIAEQVETNLLEKKVFFWREIDGVRVSRNRMVFSYYPDGTFIRMTGIWHPIDYLESQISSDVSMDELIDLAINKLESIYYNNESELPIFLETYYLPIENAKGKYVLDLRGRVNVPYLGSEGTIQRASHDFDI